MIHLDFENFGDTLVKKEEFAREHYMGVVAKMINDEGKTMELQLTTYGDMYALWFVLPGLDPIKATVLETKKEFLESLEGPIYESAKKLIDRHEEPIDGRYLQNNRMGT